MTLEQVLEVGGIWGDEELIDINYNDTIYYFRKREIPGWLKGIHVEYFNQAGVKLQKGLTAYIIVYRKKDNLEWNVVDEDPVYYANSQTAAISEYIYNERGGRGLGRLFKAIPITANYTTFGWNDETGEVTT